MEGKYALHQRAYRIHIKTPVVLPRFIFHYMKGTFYDYIMKSAFSSSVTSIRRPMLNNYPVPVPTLDVQERIVNVLDNFESLCNDLGIGLPAEIEARRRQYEYYRNRLLSFRGGQVIDNQYITFGIKVEDYIKIMQYVFGYVVLPMSEVCKVLRGRRLTKSQLSVNGKYAVYHGGIEPLGYYDHYNRTGNTVMVINVGASAGSVGYSKDDFWSSDGCYCLDFKDTIISKYAYYALLLQEHTLRSKVRYAGIPTLDAAVIDRIVITIPPITEQERIVAILDKFDALVNDISVGLPAEIEARRKQYEYYRNRLLTFKRLNLKTA